MTADRWLASLFAHDIVDDHFLGEPFELTVLSPGTPALASGLVQSRARPASSSHSWRIAIHRR